MIAHHFERYTRLPMFAKLAALFKPSPKRLPHGRTLMVAVQERQAGMYREYQVIEEAPWFGATGLPDETERELPRYLRREFGESVFDAQSIKAADLRYLGVFFEGRAGHVHYWRIRTAAESDAPAYTYIEIAPDGKQKLGWGERRPPAELRGAAPGEA